jgi:hypothetical protein
VSDGPQRYALRHTGEDAMLITEDNFYDVLAWVESSGAEVTWKGRHDGTGTRAFEISNPYLGHRGRTWHGDSEVHAAVGHYLVLGADGWFKVQTEDEFAFHHNLVIDVSASRAAVGGRTSAS